MSGLKTLFERGLPAVSDRVRAARYRRALRRIVTGMAGADGALIVRSGPFRGMQYLPQLAAADGLFRHAVVPKLLGCYETELHETLARVLGQTYERVINVGSAEGYYTVGFALRMPGVPVFAFEIDAGERALCGELARANGVADRVLLRGECTRDDLLALASGESLVVCDCEGCELELLRPDLLPGLRTCDVIVELHDCVDPAISSTIAARFASTHEVTVLPKVDRDPTTYATLATLTPHERRLAVSEFRWGPLQWGFLASRARRGVATEAGRPAAEGG